MARSMLYLLGLAAALVNAAPQGVTETITPDDGAPAGCSPSYDGQFQISIVKASAKRDLEKRSCEGEGVLALKLADGVLTDLQGWVGYIASNYQFQFDGPPQAGAIYTGGFSVCGDGTLALGSSTNFYQCLSGGFYNLYDRHWADQCEEVKILTVPCTAGGSNGGVSQIPDGQIQNPTGAVSQIPDGQIQAPTGAPTGVPSGVVSQIPDGQVQAPTGVVSQIPDGQIQAPTGVVSQIPDGQIQAPTGAPSMPVVSEISDGQIQVPTGPIVSQIPDGQIQVPTTSAPISYPVNSTAPVPVPTSGGGAAPSQVPPSSGERILPGTSVAVFIAALGALFAM